MKKVIINGKEIVTNLGESGADTIVDRINKPSRRGTAKSPSVYV